MNFIITGEVQSGKTTWCAKYSQWLGERSFKVGGALCLEARYHDNKVGYDVLDVRNGQSVTFARVAEGADFPGETVGAYRISYEGLEFVHRAILEALDSGCHMVLIDEVGHLELAGKGIAEAAETAFRRAPNTTAVVRRSLLAAFLDHFQSKESGPEFVIKDLELDASYPLPESEYTGERTANLLFAGRRI